MLSMRVKLALVTLASIASALLLAEAPWGP